MYSMYPVFFFFFLKWDCNTDKQALNNGCLYHVFDKNYFQQTGMPEQQAAMPHLWQPCCSWCPAALGSLTQSTNLCRTVATAALVLHPFLLVIEKGNVVLFGCSLLAADKLISRGRLPLPRTNMLRMFLLSAEQTLQSLYVLYFEL